MVAVSVNASSSSALEKLLVIATVAPLIWLFSGSLIVRPLSTACGPLLSV